MPEIRCAAITEFRFARENVALLKIFTYFDPRMFAKLHYTKLFNLVL